MFNIVGKRFWFFLISVIVMVAGIVSLATFGLKSGIEFSSGSLLTLQFEQKVTQDQLNGELSGLGYSDAIVQSTGEGDFLIRTHELSDTAKKDLEAALTAKFGKLTEAEFNSVSPLVASETARNAAIAVAVSAVFMLLYVTWAFRNMPSPFHYGTAAIIGLGHDVFISIGIFSILAGFLHWETNLMFITAILAILGYSINNTVVIFDRIRENLKKGVSADFEAVVNYSLVETLSRCLNTSITTIITGVAILLFVGSSIQNFVVVFLIGLSVGTFSSLCIAPTLLIVWHKKEWGRFISWLPFAPAKATK